MQFSLGSNFFVNFFVRVTIVLLVPIGFYSYTIINSETARYNSEQQVTAELLESVGQVIQEDLDFISQDLDALINSEEIKEYINNPSEEARERVESYFALLSTVSRRYDQIRILSNIGFERVRVNYSSGEAQITPVELLQDKSNRYYFSEALNLGPNESYASQLDLNVESGEIEQPHKPMIRLSHKLLNDSGDLVGVLILNYLAENILHEMDVAATLPGLIELVDDEGYWIFEEAGEFNWSRQLGNQNRFSDAHPAIWYGLKATGDDQVNRIEEASIVRLQYPRSIGDIVVESPRALYLVSEFEPLNLPLLVFNELLKPIPIGVGFILALLSLLWSRAAVKELAAEQTLKRESSIREKIISNSLIPTILINDKGLIVEFNQAAEKLFGYTMSEVLNQNVKMLMPDPMRSQHDGYLDSYKRSGVKHVIESSRKTFALTKEGNTFPVEIAVTQIWIGEKPYFVGNLRDLSVEYELESQAKAYREELEQAVEQRTMELAATNEELIGRSQEAERLASVKSEFLTNMSHEIRTPLNSIIAMSQMLQRKGSEVDSAHIGSRLVAAGQSLLTVINDILDYSKLGVNKVQLSPESFDIEKLINNLSAIMHSAALNKPEVELVINNASRLSHKVVGDEIRLQQILVNLIGNAIKFTEKGFVKLEILTLNKSSDTVELFFSVKDSGIGIAEHNRNLIFEAFEQGEASVHPKFGGSGLGLSISQSLLNLMGSTLKVESQEGKGSAFSFIVKLPIGEGSVQHQSKRLDVLIADDHEVAREAIRSIVESIGWRPDVVNGGTPVIDKVVHQSEVKDIILLDWDMPDMDGLSVAKQLKTALPSQKTPVIVMVTAYGIDKVKESPDSQFVDLLLEKPITASDLFDAYQKTIQPNTIQYKNHSDHSLENVRLLVVDDNEFNREVAVLSFESEGATVMTVNDGQEAVNWLKNNASEVDLILMDVQMPVMDGYQATEAIRKELKLDIPIVALTAGAFEQHKQAALDSGMNDFIAKPFDIEKSIQIINKWVSNDQKVEDLSIIEIEPRLKNHTALESIETIEQSYESDLFNLEQALTYWKTEGKLKTFLTRFKTEYDKVDEQLRQLDPVEAEQLAHKLKGASAVLGLLKISRHSKALMDVYNSPNLGDVDQLLNELQATLDETWRIIDQFTQ